MRKMLNQKIEMKETNATTRQKGKTVRLRSRKPNLCQSRKPFGALNLKILLKKGLWASQAQLTQEQGLWARVSPACLHKQGLGTRVSPACFNFRF